MVERLLAGPDQILDVPALEPRKISTELRRILTYVADASRPKARGFFWLVLFAGATIVSLCLVIQQYFSGPFRGRGVRHIFGSSGNIPPGRNSESESRVKKGEGEPIPKVGLRSGGIITQPNGVANGKARLDAHRGVPGELRRFGPGNGYWLNRVAFSPDERHVIACGGAVIWYDLESRREIRRVMEVVGARSGLALSSDGRFFLTAHTNDPVLRMGEVVSGSEVQSFRGHSAGIVACTLSPNGLQAASAGQDGTLRLWNTGNGREVRRFTGDAGAAMCVAFLTDGRRILSGHKENGGKHAICLWDAETGERQRRFDGHSGPVHAVVAVPDGRSFVSASEDGTVKRWELESGTELQNLSHRSAVHSVAVSSDGRRMLSSEWGNAPIVLHLWELSSGREMHRFLGHTGHVLDVVFSSDNRFALSSDTAGFAILWRLPPEIAR
jgi:WD40 repeat protein